MSNENTTCECGHTVEMYSIASAAAAATRPQTSEVPVLCPHSTICEVHWWLYLVLTTSLALTRVGSSTAAAAAAESAKVKAQIADSRLGLLSFTADDGGDGDEDDSGGSVVEIKYH